MEGYLGAGYDAVMAGDNAGIERSYNALNQVMAWTNLGRSIQVYKSRRPSMVSWLNSQEAKEDPQRRKSTEETMRQMDSQYRNFQAALRSRVRYVVPYKDFFLSDVALKQLQLVTGKEGSLSLEEWCRLSDWALISKKQMVSRKLFHLINHPNQCFAATFGGVHRTSFLRMASPGRSEVPITLYKGYCRQKGTRHLDVCLLNSHPESQRLKEFEERKKLAIDLGGQLGFVGYDLLNSEPPHD